MFPNSTVINNRTATCYSGDREGRSSRRKKETILSLLFLQKNLTETVLKSLAQLQGCMKETESNFFAREVPVIQVLTGELSYYQFTITPAVKLEWTVGGEPRKTDHDLSVQSERRSLSSSNLDITVSSKE